MKPTMTTADIAQLAGVTRRHATGQIVKRPGFPAPYQVDQLQAQLVRQQKSYEAEIKVEIDSALERAAEVCETFGADPWAVSKECADAIRALKDES